MGENFARYQNENSFTEFLTRIGVGATQVAHLRDDEFTTMMDLIEFFQFSTINEITKFFYDINKAYATAGRRELRVKFPSRVILRLSGVIWYFAQCIYTFHTVPDLHSITGPQATSLGTLA